MELDLRNEKIKTFRDFELVGWLYGSERMNAYLMRLGVRSLNKLEVTRLLRDTR